MCATRPRDRRFVCMRRQTFCMYAETDVLYVCGDRRFVCMRRQTFCMHVTDRQTKRMFANMPGDRRFVCMLRQKFCMYAETDVLYARDRQTDKTYVLHEAPRQTFCMYAETDILYARDRQTDK